jgi:hypothetical protein
MQKQIEKIMITSTVILKNMIMFRHVGAIHVAGQNTNLKQKNESKNPKMLPNLAVILFLFSAAILGNRRHLESDRN